MAYRIEYEEKRSRKRNASFRRTALLCLFLGAFLWGTYQYWPTGREILDNSFREIRTFGTAVQAAAEQLKKGECAADAFRCFYEKLLDGSWLA